MCHSLAEKHDGYFLSTEYKNSKTKYLWKCNNFLHPVFLMRYDYVFGGRWCKYCNGYNDINTCHSLAKEKDGYFLSDKYINSMTDYVWKCSNKNHLPLTMRYSHVKSGSWCSFCSRFNTIEDCYNLAKENDGYFLSTEYIDNKTKYKWKCNIINHSIFTMLYSNVEQGSWCPECSCGKTQKKIKSIIENIFDTRVILNYKGFDWLKNKKKMEIDIWVPELKLAIEYDGKQHFEEVRFGKKSVDQIKQDFIKTQHRDKLKNKIIFDHPEEIKYFIRFNYKEKITEDFIVEKLKMYGVINGRR